MVGRTNTEAMFTATWPRRLTIEWADERAGQRSKRRTGRFRDRRQGGKHTMRCPQCGSNSSPEAAFCARCGTRLFEPKPADKREYALMRVHPAWWHFIGAIVFSCVLIAAGFAVRFKFRNE